MDLRALRLAMFDAAVSRAQPSVCLPPHLPEPPDAGRLLVLACGKAGATMAEAVERHYLDGGRIAPERLVGICVTRHGYGRPLRRIRCVEAGHPVPDEAGLRATAETLALARSATAGDLALVLISGGGSANWTAPAPGLSIEDKQTLTRALLKSGAPIGDINTVRKHLSRIKGGRLAAALAPARSLSLVISDVPGDDPSFIASGPTVHDRTTAEDALAILDKWAIPVPAPVRTVIRSEAGETPSPDDPAFALAEYRIVARPADSLAAAAAVAEQAGYQVVAMGDALEGEARTVAAEHATLALSFRDANRRCVLLSGGELTVTVRGDGRGGPNQEYALAFAQALEGTNHIAGLAADTDGTDGGGGDPGDPAGALFDSGTAARARGYGLNPAHFLENNDATTFFERLEDLVATGPTGTNVNDFRCVVVDNAGEPGP